LFAILGLKVEEERAKNDREAATKCGTWRVLPPIGVDVDDAVIPINDRIVDERLIMYDKDNPELKLEARFPSMEELRFSIGTYAIKAKFELRLQNRQRYISCILQS
jgi:hypothetical protein